MLTIRREFLEHLFLTVSGPDEEIDYIREALSFVDKKLLKDYESQVRSGGHPPYPPAVSFFQEDDKKFYRGHLNLVLEALKNQRVEFKLDLGKQSPKKDLVDLYGVTYRDYQRESIEAALEKKRGIIKVATAGGKTVIAAGIVKSINEPSIFLVTTVPLLHQAVESFHKFGIQDVGIIGDKIKKLGRNIVADARYITRLIKEDAAVRKIMASVNVLVADEGHHSPAVSFTNNILACRNAEYNITLSGTPFESNQFGDSIRDVQLVGMFGEVIHEVTALELIELGFIARPLIYVLNSEGDPVKRGEIKSHWQRGRQYNKIYEEGIVFNKGRNRKAVDIIYILTQLKKMQVLVLVSQVRHGVELLKLLKDLDISAVFMAGSKQVYKQDIKNPETDKIDNFKSNTVEEFREGKYNVLIGSPVMGEGFDLPGDMVEALVLLAGGKGLIPVLQRLGRALRPKSDGRDVYVVDFMDFQHFYLENHSRRRIDEYRREGYDVFHDRDFSRDFFGEEL